MSLSSSINPTQSTTQERIQTRIYESSSLESEPGEGAQVSSETAILVVGTFEPTPVSRQETSTEPRILSPEEEQEEKEKMFN